MFAVRCFLGHLRMNKVVMMSLMYQLIPEFGPRLVQWVLGIANLVGNDTVSGGHESVRPKLFSKHAWSSMIIKHGGVVLKRVAIYSYVKA
jgi:hypothetical protein